MPLAKKRDEIPYAPFAEVDESNTYSDLLVFLLSHVARSTVISEVSFKGTSTEESFNLTGCPKSRNSIEDTTDHSLIV